MMWRETRETISTYLPRSGYVANLMIYLSTLPSLRTCWPWTVGSSCKLSKPSSEGFRRDVRIYTEGSSSMPVKHSTKITEWLWFFQGNSRTVRKRESFLLLPAWRWEGKKQFSCFSGIHRSTHGHKDCLWKVRALASHRRHRGEGLWEKCRWASSSWASTVLQSALED